MYTLGVKVFPLPNTTKTYCCLKRHVANLFSDSNRLCCYYNYDRRQVLPTENLQKKWVKSLKNTKNFILDELADNDYNNYQNGYHNNY